MTPERCEELRKQQYNATVVDLRKPNSDLMIMRVRPDFPIPKHKAGQYTTLGMGTWEPRLEGCQPETPKPGTEDKLIRRAYSISNSVLDEQEQLIDITQCDWLEFYVVLVRDTGAAPPALTPRLFTLNVGDRLFVGKKITGHYNLDPVKPTDTVIFLSTGTGEAPHNYMLRELLGNGHQGAILAACCVRYRRDLGYAALHDVLMRKFPQYTYIPLTTREADTIDNKIYIQDLIVSGRLEEKLGKTLDPSSTHVYLCGNPKMIGLPEINRETNELVYPEPKGVVELLEQRNFQRDRAAEKFQGNIHFEEYW